VLAQRRRVEWCDELLRDSERDLFGLGVFALFQAQHHHDFHVIELMLNAVNLAFVAFSQALGKLDGQVFRVVRDCGGGGGSGRGIGIIILIARNRQP